MNTATTSVPQDLRIIGVEQSHDTLHKVVLARPPCSILDVPAGEGVFCALLKEHGWQVHAADIDPGNFRLRDVPFTKVNLNRALPFADASFDAVSCVNGLHRLLFPEVAIREFYRILKPGGTLYVNVNNYSSMWKRLRFLFTGSLDNEIDHPDCRQTILDPEAHVRLPLMYPRLREILVQSGFRIDLVLPAAVRMRDRLASPLALAVHGTQRLGRAARGAPPLAGNHRAVIGGGAYLFIEAVKQPASTAA